MLINVFRLLVFSLAVLQFTQRANGKIKNSVQIDQVDSVEVFFLGPWSTNETRADRLHFEEIYQIVKKNCSGCAFRIVLTDPKDYTIMIKILNSLDPLQSVAVKPSEVKLLTTRVHDLCNMMPLETNDPIRVNKKIKIFMRNGSIREAFSSRFYLDIDDWRYKDDGSIELLLEWFILFYNL